MDSDKTTNTIYQLESDVGVALPIINYCKGSKTATLRLRQDNLV